jgi:hypothetical protein
MVKRLVGKPDITESTTEGVPVGMFASTVRIAVWKKGFNLARLV